MARRLATPMEARQFGEWSIYYKAKLTPQIIRFGFLAEAAGQVQLFMNDNGIKLPGGPIFTQADIEQSQRALHGYNVFGSAMEGVFAAKYGIQFRAGDIDIVAPADMDPEKYRADLWPPDHGLGSPAWIIYVLIGGAIVVAGIWAVSQALENETALQSERNRKEMQRADAEIMKSPDPKVRADWMKLRADIQKGAEIVQQQTGLLTDLFGTKTGTAIGALVVGAIALFALSQLAPLMRRRGN